VGIRSPFPVELRVTLSYMVEPNSGRRGMRGAYTYASHHLRFAIKAPDQSVDAFERRIAESAEAETDGITAARALESDGHRLLGTQNRNRGSLHSDVWRGSAVQLAQCGILAVHPVGGWWKNHDRQDRIGRSVTYALLVSLSTDVGTDLYTPIATQPGIPVSALASPEVGTHSDSAGAGLSRSPAPLSYAMVAVTASRTARCCGEVATSPAASSALLVLPSAHGPHKPIRGAAAHGHGRAGAFEDRSAAAGTRQAVLDVDRRLRVVIGESHDPDDALADLRPQGHRPFRAPFDADLVVRAPVRRTRARVPTPASG